MFKHYNKQQCTWCLRSCVGTLSLFNSLMPAIHCKGPFNKQFSKSNDVFSKLIVPQILQSYSTGNVCNLISSNVFFNLQDVVKIKYLKPTPNLPHTPPILDGLKSFAKARGSHINGCSQWCTYLLVSLNGSFSVTTLETSSGRKNVLRSYFNIYSNHTLYPETVNRCRRFVPFPASEHAREACSQATMCMQGLYTFYNSYSGIRKEKKNAL